MKKIVFLIFFLTISTFFHAQNRISGTISEENSNLPLAGAYIYITEWNKGVVSDENGNYSITLTTKGRLTLQYSYLSYEPVVKEVILSDSNTEQTLDIQLKKHIIQMDEVVLSNSYINTQSTNTYEVDVVDIDNIAKVGGFSVMDIINKIPGVDAVTSGTMVSRPSIRGLSSNRVLTVIDGVRFETQQWDDEHGIGVNENGFEKIEVIKGPESLLYGPEAMGGVINFVKTKPAPIGTTKGSAFAAMSTNNLGWRANAKVDGAKENLNWGVSALGKLFSDYFIDNQSFRIPNTRLLEYGAKGYVGTNRKWGSTNLEYTFNQAFFGILDGKDITFGPNGEIINSDIEKEKYPFEIEAPFHTVVDNRLTSHSTFLTGKSKVDLVVGYQNNHRTENEELTGVKKGYKYVDMTLQSLTYNLKWYAPTWNRFSTIVGSQGMYQNNTNNSGAQTVLIPDARIKDFGLFAVNKYQYQAFNFSLGARFDSRNLDTDETNGLNYTIPEISKSYNNVSGSAGIAYTIAKKLTLRSSFATGYRSPNLNELTSNGFKLESQRFEVGNANFKKEHNQQFDLNAVYANESISIEGAFFVNTIQNYIYIEPTGTTVPSNLDPATNVPLYEFQQSEAQITGGEATLSIHPEGLKWFRLDNSFATLKGIRTDDDSYLPMMNPTKLTNTLFITLNDFGKFSSSVINLTVASTFDQDQVAENELKTPGYSIFNLGISTSYKKTAFTLTANNIFDRNYINHMSRFRPYKIAEPGLNIALSVKIPLDLN